METIFEKYERLRPAMCDGDLIAFHGTKPLARIIQSSDKNSDGSWARHNHIGVIVEKHGALYIEDSNGKGVQADRLSWRVKHDYPNGDFTIIKPLVSKELIDAEMHRLLKRSDDKWINMILKMAQKN